MFEAHGGKLINRIVRGEAREELLSRTVNMPEIILANGQLVEVENIATGLYSPLEGFMDEINYLSVINNMCLKDGTIWTIPIVLGVGKDEAVELKVGEEVALKGRDGRVYAVLELNDKYIADIINEGEMV